MRQETGVETPAEAAVNGPASRLGLTAGQVVQEFGYDDDVDEEFRYAVEDLVEGELEDEDYDGVADAVLMWWRDGDGDLVDAVVDALTGLAESGSVLLLTPKAGRAGEVDASDIEESALTAGLHTSGTVSIGPDWAATRLVAPKSARR